MTKKKYYQKIKKYRGNKKNILENCLLNENQPKKNNEKGYSLLANSNGDPYANIAEEESKGENSGSFYRDLKPSSASHRASASHPARASFASPEGLYTPLNDFGNDTDEITNRMAENRIIKQKRVNSSTRNASAPAAAPAQPAEPRRRAVVRGGPAMKHITAAEIETLIHLAELDKSLSLNDANDDRKNREKCKT